jgi:hypothetical protein
MCFCIQTQAHAAWNTAPNVSILSPSSTTPVSGTVEIKAQATDGSGVRKIKFYIDGDAGTEYTNPNVKLTSFTATHSWNTTSLTPGSTHTIIARAYDRFYVSKDATIQLTIANTTDSQPPVVVIQTAKSGSWSGDVVVTASATDNVSVSNMQLLIDTTSICTSTTGTLSCTIHTPNFSNATHSLIVKATDPSGNTGQAVQSITIFNDTTPPSNVSIIPPASQPISGTAFILEALASDDVAVLRVDFYGDGKLIGSDSGTRFTIAIDTTKYVDGNHNFMVQAFDSAGNFTSSPTMIISIKNAVPPPSDTTPPTVTVVPPATQPISGSYTITTTNVSDNVGVTQVDFYVDGNLLGSDISNPYSYVLDSTSVVNGTHTIFAKAKDAAGNEGTSASVSISVNNTTPPPPTGTTKIQLLNAGNMQSSELDFIATKFDTFVMSATQMGWSKIKGLRDRITVMNPRKYMHCYIKVAGIHDEDKHYPATTSNMYWYGPSGQKLINSWNGWYYIDIITPAVHNAWVTLLGNYIQDPTVVVDNSGNTYSMRQMFDGVFWDNSSCMMNTVMEDPVSGNVITPSNYTDSSYYAAVDDVLRSMKNGTTTFNPAGWPTDMVANSYRGDAPSADLRGVTLVSDVSGRKGVDGLMFEDFMLRGYGEYNLRTYNTRDRIHQNLRDFEKVSYDYGKKAYADEYFYIPEKCAPGNCYPTDKTSNVLTPAQAKQLRHFAFAAYLLVYNPNTYFQMIPQNSDNIYYTQYFPEYTLDMGQPVAFNCSGADGLSGPTTRFCDSIPDKMYVRTFQNGMVVVNPDSVSDSSAPASRDFILPAIVDCPSGNTCHWEQLEFIGGGAVIHSGSAVTPQGNIQATSLKGIATKNMPKNSGLILRKVVE